MECGNCQKKLRKDNTIGFCREHRSQAPKIKNYQEEFRKANPTISNKAKENWRKANPNYGNERLKKDPNAKIAHSIRTRMNMAIKRKPGSSTKALGCSIEDFKKYIETLFEPGMTWKNHGKWHFDHIIPLIEFDLTLIAEFEKACHFTNIRPLWRLDNLKRPKRLKSSHE